MRTFAIGWLCAAACGGAVNPPSLAPPAAGMLAPAPGRAPGRTVVSEPIDPITALTHDAVRARSWLVPGPIQLELGGTQLTTGRAARPIEVVAIDRQGNLERVAVQLDHARFSVWTDRAHLLAVIRRDVRVAAAAAAPVGAEVGVVLRAGATVTRLAHRDRTTQIRYLGALQVEAWVADELLSDRGPPRQPAGRIASGGRPQLVVPGTVIRSEPRWAARELAIMASGYFVDAIRDVDDAWAEVSYRDGDLAVRGFVSRRDPPGRVHRWGDGDRTAPTIAANATAASGTCLYARARGDAIGYVVGDRPAELEDTGAGWWSLSLDTPWGPLAFAARGPTRSELVACAPPDSVPPSTPARAP
jgi:hypothetical protein